MEMSISDSALCDSIQATCGENEDLERRLDVVKITSPSWIERRRISAKIIGTLIDEAAGKKIFLADVISVPINDVWTNVTPGLFKAFLGDVEKQAKLAKGALNRSVFVRTISFSFLIAHVAARLS